MPATDLVKINQEIRAWLLMSFTGERFYAGNLGYADRPTEIYRYDSHVANSRQIAEGDLALLRSKDRFLGIAKIEKLECREGTKELFPCPECKSTELTKRKKQIPTFRCVNGHTFDTPLTKSVPCQLFEAHFGTTFLPLEGILTLDELKQACPKYNRQLAMQRLDFNRLKTTLLEKASQVANLLIDLSHEYIDANLGEPDERSETLSLLSYTPNEEDRRQVAMRQIRARRGQQQFRQALRERYGDRCLITGCKLMDIVEAAHISPYRGEADNHPENGLLLRTDLHTLLDLDLLGIDPTSLKVHFHQSAREAGYEIWEGKMLLCTNQRPSYAALESRWSRFLARTST